MSGPIFPEAGPSLSPDRPSLFELLADEQLRDLFHPVIRYVLSYFAQKYPRYLIKVLHRHEEVYALIMIILERHHLKKHNASVSEHFYQLNLVQTPPTPTPRLDMIVPRPKRGLRRSQRWGMLFFLVGLPYIRIKAQQKFDRLRSEEEEEGASRRLLSFDRGFRTLYPYINLGLDVGLLGYDVAYLFDKTDNYRPWHRWLGLQVERKGPDDTPSTEKGLMSKLPPLLPPLLLVLKLSQWWYSPSSPRSLPVPQTSGTNHNLIIPPRPLPILPTADIYPPLPSDHPPSEENEEEPEGEGKEDEEGEKDGSGLERYKIGKEDYGKCPLCRRKWQNPAILESGWVVCWRCGWDAIQGDGDGDDDGVGGDGDEGTGRRKGICPITGVEVSRTDLRRVLL